MKYQNEQKKLKALVRDLERELSEGKNQVEALAETNERLREAERICQELVDENRHLRDEMTNWQNRFAEDDEHKNQIADLRQQLDALQTEHARVIENNREIKEKLTAHSETPMISSHVENESTSPTIPRSEEDRVAPLASDFAESSKANDLPIASDGVRETDPPKEARASRKFRNLTGQNWRSRVTFAGAILVISLGAVITLGVLGIKILRTERISNDHADPHETVAGAQAAKLQAPTAVLITAPRIRGTFQTVRPAHVFSEPSENSALVAEIGKGVKLSVVGSRNGWLEIHSKHGRPPGFMRQEEAIRIGSN